MCFYFCFLLLELLVEEAHALHGLEGQWVVLRGGGDVLEQQTHVLHGVVVAEVAHDGGGVEGFVGVMRDLEGAELRQVELDVRR